MLLFAIVAVPRIPDVKNCRLKKKVLKFSAEKKVMNLRHVYEWQRKGAEDIKFETSQFFWDSGVFSPEKNSRYFGFDQQKQVQTFANTIQKYQVGSRAQFMVVIKRAKFLNGKKC